MKKEEHVELIKADLYRYEGNDDFKTLLRNLVKNSGFKYTYVFRKCQYYRKNNRFKYHIFKIFLRRYKYKFGYEIPDQVKVGKGLYINHLGGITINPKAEIGDNANITKGVTIGQTNRGSKKGVPVIGNKVWIGANASIVGKVKIGNNVLIAPNAYVNFNVPNDSIVIGNPAQIISNINATNGYVNNIV